MNTQRILEIKKDIRPLWYGLQYGQHGKLVQFKRYIGDANIYCISIYCIFTHTVCVTISNRMIDLVSHIERLIKYHLT